MTEAQHYDDTDTLVLDETYGYDAFGELIQTEDGGTVTKYGVDGWISDIPAGTGNANFNDWAVINADGTLQTRTIFGNQP